MTDPLAYRFVNKLGAGDGRLEIDYAAGRLVLEWQLFVANGDESPAQGVIDRTASGGESFGTCLTTGIYPGVIHVDSGGSSGWFDLGGPIGSGPDGCGSELGNTSVVGCFAAPPDDPR